MRQLVIAFKVHPFVHHRGDSSKTWVTYSAHPFFTKYYTTINSLSKRLSLPNFFEFLTVFPHVKKSTERWHLEDNEPFVVLIKAL